MAGSDLVWQAEAGAEVADGMHEVHEEAELGLAQQLVAVYVTQTPHLSSNHGTQDMTLKTWDSRHGLHTWAQVTGEFRDRKGETPDCCCQQDCSETAKETLQTVAVT